MTDRPTPPSGPYADIAPALDDLTQRVLFGEVWERLGLSNAKYDRYGPRIVGTVVSTQAVDSTIRLETR